MPYVNSRLCALVAMGLSLLAVPGIHAQNASTAPAPIRGDVDGDGRVTRADAEAVRAYLVRGTLPGGRSILPAGDANGDGRVTAADAALISRFAAGVDVSRFPVGRPVGEGGGGRTGARAFITTDYECVVDVGSGAASCRVADATGADGARLDVIAGVGPLTFVGSWQHFRTAAGGAATDTSVNTLSFTNNMGQPIGTTDGVTADPDGNRLFFTTVPYVVSVYSGTVAQASIALDNADGTASFSNSTDSWASRPYYQYVGVVAPGATSASRPMRYVYSESVKSFGYKYRVSTPVQYENGWITVAPATVPVLAPAETASLTGTVYDAFGTVLADGITWSSSNTAVATVNASTGVVTAVATGTTTITATSSVNAQRTGTRVITVDEAPTVTSTIPANAANSVLPGSNIVVNFSEAVTVTAASFSLECPVASSQGFSISGSGTNAVTINPDADLPAATTCTVTVLAAGVSDADANDGPNLMAADYVFSFETAIQALNDVFSDTTTGNVSINSASTDPVFSVTTNDKLNGSTTISFAGWGGVPAKTMAGGDVVMDTEGDGMGQFTYDPPAGFEGTDSLEYTIQSGSATSTAKVALPVSGMIWFVNNGGASCTSRANGCGRLSHPYSTLAAFQAENNGTGNNPAPGDAVFLYESATPYTGPVTLLATQKLIGQDAGASLSTITGITPATGSAALPGMNPGANAVTINGASGGVVLGANNLLRGFGIATTGGTALSGTGFGTPTIAEVTLSASAGAALVLDNGTVNSTFATASSTNSTGRGISLTNVSGSLTFGAGSISGSANAAFLVSGGNVGVTWPGSISQANSAPLVDVQGSHNGTLTFSGTLNATNGTGLQFNAALGTYTFSGTTTLNGGDAGVDITNGSTGTFNFNASTSITNPTGTGLNVYGSAPTLVSYAGSISKSGASVGRLVEVGEMTSGGTVTFVAGSNLSSTSTAGTGIGLSNADGAVSFNGTTTLNGGDAGVDLLSGTGGTVTFAAGTAITNPSGTAFNVNASTPNVTFNGSITKNGTSAGRLVDITGQTGGGSLALNNTITFTGGTLSSTSSTGTGILLSDVDGTVNFSGTTTLNGGDAGIDVEGGSGGVIAFGANASVTNSTNELIRVVSSAPTFTYSGSFTRNSGTGPGILAQSNTGGTLSFNGDPATETKSIAIASGGNIGVSLVGNTGSTVNFTGGTLVISTDDGAGFNATGGGTVTVTGTANTVNATGGVAVNVANTNIGAGGMEFRSVSANGGSSGIVLNTTGNDGGLTVTGTGSAGTGGTIQNMTTSGASFTSARNINLSWMNFTNANSVDGGGAGLCDAATNTGCNGAIKLSSVTTVNLDRLTISGGVEQGINGTNVTDLSLTNSTIQNTGDAVSEHGIYIQDLKGTTAAGTANLISGNTITNAGSHNVFIMTSTATNAFPGSPDRLVIQNNNITNPGSAGQSDGITVAVRSTGNYQTVVQSNTFSSTRTCTDAVQVDAGGSSRSDAVITSNTIQATYTVGGTNIAGCNTAINVSGASTSNTTFSVTNNPTVQAGVGTAINVASNGDANLRGTISGHTNITVPAGLRDGTSSGTNLENNGFGIDMVADATGSIVANVDGNTVNGMAGGIRATARNTSVAEVDVTIQNSTFNSGGLFALWPVLLASGNGNGQPNRVCANLVNNQTSTTAAFTEHYWLEQWTGNTFQLQGLSPASGATEAQVEAFVSSRDIGGATVEAFGGTSVAYTAATCATP